jgi:hypothetical protein
LSLQVREIERTTDSVLANPTRPMETVKGIIGTTGVGAAERASNAQEIEDR